MESHITVSTTSSSLIVACTGATSYSFPFIGVSASDIIVVYTTTAGVSTTLSPTAYTVSINAPLTGQVWGLGGTISPTSPSSYTSGAFTISRILPLTQSEEISNQGNQYPLVTEQALDILCMEIQQVSARTGQFRSTWVSNATYNYADIVQDGVNGANTGNYYFCVQSNTSSVWASDLASGYWVLAIQSTLPSAALPLSIGNGGTGQITAAAALNALGGIALAGTNAFTGANSFTGGYIAVPTAGTGDSTTKAASTAFVNGTALTLANGTTAVTQSAGNASTKIATTAYIDRGASGASMVFLASMTANNSSSITFNNIPTGYDSYMLDYTNIVPISNNQILNYVFSLNNGSSYLQSGGYTWNGITYGTSGTASQSGYTNGNSLVIGNFGVSNATGIGVSGHLILKSLVNSSNYVTTVIDHGEGWYETGAISGYTSSGLYSGTTGQINAIQFFYSSGNIATGKFSLYGMRNS